LGIWSLYLDLAKWGITCRMWIIWEGVCVKQCTTLPLGKQWPLLQEPYMVQNWAEEGFD
jgi:hypothetical protein